MKAIKALVRFLCLYTSITALSVLLITAPAFAVNEYFELEGNIANNGAAVPGDVDWVDLFDVSGTNVPTPKSTLPANFGPASFVRDFKLKANGSWDSSDNTTYTTGSKDTLNISSYNGNPAGWQCTNSNNVGNQVDLINIYATAFAAPSGDLIIYFGAERNGNNGTKNIGFWFLKDSTVGCAAGPGETNDFTGNHMNGDLFIVSEFSNGGRVSSVKVYQWVGEAGGHLDPNPLYTGVDCKDAATGDLACATVNSEDTLGTTLGVFTPPWLTQTEQPGNTPSTNLQAWEFFEGGVNLTALKAAGCYTTFLANTRSSDSLTATIFDFAVGGLPLCGISVDKACTTPTEANPNPVIDTSDYESFITKFDVTISKSGPAGLFDVTLEEDSSFATGETCKIIAISGCASGAPTLPVLNFQNGDPVQICDTLGVTPITVQIECDTFVNGFLNSVTARAATSDGGAKNLTKSDTMSQAEACKTVVNPALIVNKICHDLAANHDLTLVDQTLASHPANPKAVKLVYDGTTFKGFGVDVFVQIENTGNIKLENITLSDVPAISFTPVTISQGSNTHAPTTFDGTLTPGQKAYFTGSYVAPAPDVYATDPCQAVFSDKVTVTATDAISGIPLDPVPFDTTTCVLCAPCLNYCNQCPSPPSP